MLYTGDSSTQSITGVGFQPDWTWIKNRSGANNHVLTDAVRGATETLFSDSTSAELTVAQALTSFDSDGFTVGYDGSAIVNQNTNAYVAWNWLASNTTASNTVGSITSTVSVNTTSGFSIVSYTGNNTSSATVGHGLGIAPSMVICKNRTAGTGSGAWPVWHSSLSSVTSYVFLNTTAAQASGNNNFTAAPTSTVLNLGTSDTNNTATMIAYCFAEVPGYSAIGSYTGNGDSDGPFVYTGFRPAWVLIKRTDVLDFWMVYDAARSPYNQEILALYPNASNADTTETNNPIDAVSNGFKCRGAGSTSNTNTGTYIYMAFAENPFKNSNAR